eukprot:m.120761 g.120761  ORF g.120761 m.120761 type:complete len:1080 (-) comp14561_c0_seq1:146-3385(-)
MARMCACAVLALALFVASASAGLVVYSDALGSGWVDYSWPAGASNFASSAFVRSGSRSIATTVAQWQALSLHSNTALPTASYSAVSFYIYPTIAGVSLQVQGTVNSVAQSGLIVPSTGAFPANTWTRVVLSLPSIGITGANFDGFFLQLASATSTTFYVDDVSVLPSTTTVYADALASGWADYSWPAGASNFASTAVVRSGSTRSIATTVAQWQALSLHANTPLLASQYSGIRLFVNPGSATGVTLRAQATVNSVAQTATVNIPSSGALAANTWTRVDLSLASLGITSGSFDGFWLQLSSATSVTFYTDDINLVLNGCTSTTASTTAAPTTIPASTTTTTTAAPGSCAAVASGAGNRDDLVVYDSQLQNGWQSWSWANTVDFSSTAVVRSGPAAVRVYANQWEAFYLHHDAFLSTAWSALSFYVYITSSGTVLTVQATLKNVVQSALYTIPSPAINTWTAVSIPLSFFGVANTPFFDGFQIKLTSAATTFYLDDITLTGLPIPATTSVSVNAAGTVRLVDTRVFGINTAVWDSYLPGSGPAISEAGFTTIRFPGGSTADDYDWSTGKSMVTPTTTYSTSFAQFATMVKSINAQTIITVNYGSGTPQMAANWVSAAKAQNYPFTYWEVGNENYGSWEVDWQSRAHDPVVYANRFVQYKSAMKAVDSTIKIGAVVVPGEDEFANYNDQAVVNPRTGQSHSGWTAVMLARFKVLGVYPDFVVYHRYPQNPGTESDSILLQSAESWQRDAADLRQQITDYIGTANGNGIELLVTENNAISYNPNKQSTSLVNALYMADSIGQLLQTEFNSLVWWDLRNSQETHPNGALLYGWRSYGDYGVLYNANDRYPTFYASKILTQFARAGDTVLPVTSSNPLVGVYAVKRQSGSVALLVVNKNPTYGQTLSFSITGFSSGSITTVYTYGKPQDLASTGFTTCTIAGATSFSFTAPAYSISVLVVRSSAQGSTADLADSSGSTSTSSSGTGVIAVVATAVVVMAAGVVFLVLRRRQSAPVNPASSSLNDAMVGPASGWVDEENVLGETTLGNAFPEELELEGDMGAVRGGVLEGEQAMPSFAPSAHFFRK